MFRSFALHYYELSLPFFSQSRRIMTDMMRSNKPTNRAAPPLAPISRTVAL